MTDEEKKLVFHNNKEEIENLKIVYEEAKEARNRKLRSIEILSQKINWVLVGSSVVFIYLIQDSQQIALFCPISILLLASICICLIAIIARPYNMGLSTTDLLDNYQKPTTIILRSIIDRINKDLNSQEGNLYYLSLSLKAAITCFVVSLLLLYINSYL